MRKVAAPAVKFGLFLMFAVLAGTAFLSFVGPRDVTAQLLSPNRGRTTAAVAQDPVNAVSPAATFCNAAAITINDNSNATPYPSNITVSGMTGYVTKVTVNVNGFSHSFPSDVSMLLVGPQGQKMILQSQAGDDVSTVPAPANITYDDAATQHLPDSSGIVTGTYRPGNYTGLETSFIGFGAPAPTSSITSPYAATLATFNATNPNGTWSLYVIDSFTGDAGSITGGWCLNITTAPTALLGQRRILQGSIAGNEPTLVGRLVRDAITSQSTQPAKACPGVTGTSALFYDTFSIKNNNSVTVPVTVTPTTSCGNAITVGAYSPTFVPDGTFCTNYIADPGRSPSASGVGTSFSFNLAPGQDAQLLVSQTTAGTLCNGYSLLVEGNLLAQAPTAAGVSVSGRVFGSGSRPLANTLVTITRDNGQSVSVRTSSTGAFQFDDLEGGHTYILQVNSRRYDFQPRVIELNDSVAGLDLQPISD